MAQNVWNAGAVDNIFAPYDWSNGAPMPGDTLVIGSGTAFLGNSDIYGDTIALSGADSATQPTLIAYGSADANVRVAQDLFFPPAGGGTEAYGTVDVVGAPQLSLDASGGPEAGVTATVNILGYSQMRGGFTEGGTNGDVTINGTSTSTFANTLSSQAGTFNAATVNATVVGAGVFDIGALDSMRFTAGVSSGQVINDNGGALTIADTRDFHASVAWSPGTLIGQNDTISLPGLTADHSSYQNGVLSLTSGGNDVFDFHVTTTPSGNVVAAQVSGGIDVYASAASAASAGATLLAHA